jgi:putative ABC transport system permease protein
MGHFVEISVSDVLFSLGAVAIVAVVSISYRLTLEKNLAVGAIRTFVQLIVVGYLLKWVFGLDKWYAVLAMVVVMTLVAGYHGARRVPGPAGRNVLYATGAIMVSSAAILFYTFAVVIRVEPWYKPHYLIPVSGMVINGAMNGVSVGMSTLKTAVDSGAERIETALSLGATGRLAISSLVKNSVRTALIPTVNGLMTAGIVQLPGMMSGQIIAGVDPTQAVLYQIVIYYVLAAANCLAVILGLRLYSASFFNRAQQLVSQ